MAPDAAELFLGHEEPRSDPTLPLIADVPAFDVAANCFDDRESGFDQIGAGQRHAQLLRNPKMVPGQRFFQTFR